MVKRIFKEQKTLDTNLGIMFVNASHLMKQDGDYINKIHPVEKLYLEDAILLFSNVVDLTSRLENFGKNKTIGEQFDLISFFEISRLAKYYEEFRKQHQSFHLPKKAKVYFKEIHKILNQYYYNKEIQGNVKTITQHFFDELKNKYTKHYQFEKCIDVCGEDYEGCF